MVQILNSLVVFVVLFISCEHIKKSTLTMFSDDIPCDIPLIFAPGIMSTDNHNVAYSPS